MPIYEYACTACGERTEAKQSFDEPPLEECPHCGGRLRKLYSPVGIVFKGSGFYSTDAKTKTTTKADGDAKKKDKSEKTDTAAASQPAAGSKSSSSKEKSA